MVYDPAEYDRKVQEYLAMMNGGKTPYMPPADVSTQATAEQGGNPFLSAALNVGVRRGLGAISGTGGSGGGAVASTADGGVMFANGTTAPGVATASNGGTVLADGSVVGGSGGTGIASGSVGAVMAPLAVGAIGAYTASKALEAYDKSRHRGFAGGVRQGIKTAGPLNYVPLLGQAAWLAGGIGGMTGGKTNRDQLRRDALRRYLREQGFADSNNNVELPGGVKYDIGLDGHASLTNAEGQSRHPYDVDFKNPLAQTAVANIDPLAAILSGGDKKLTSDLTGYLTNAALSNSKGQGPANGSVLSFYQKAGLNKDKAFTSLADLEKAGSIDRSLGDIYRNSLNNLFGSSALASSSKRSTTVSPGISKSGQRISYGKK